MDTSKYTLISDVGFYESPIDFVKMKSAGVVATIVRVGQNIWKDPKFNVNWNDSKVAGLYRGSYWFYDSRVSPITQAEIWAEMLDGDYGELPLFADFEERYNGEYKGSNNLKIFIEEIKRLIPNKEVMIYSGYYWMKENISSSYFNYFKQYSLWLADYDSEPMVPEPFDKWEIWQFDDKGSGTVYGCGGGAVDLNYFNGNFEEFKKRFNLKDIGASPIEDAVLPESKSTHVGVEFYSLKRFGTNCYIHVIDTKKAKVSVTPRGNFGTVKSAIKKYNAQIGVNGGGWPQPSIPNVIANEIWVSNGNYIVTSAKDDRGFINITKDGSLEIRQTDKNISGLWNVWGFDRILGTDGIFNSKIKDTYTKDARTGTGITKDGKLVLLSAEGNDYYQKGLTFKEMWSVLSEFECIIGGNNDGGSSTQVVNTAISENSLFSGSDGKDANVMNHVLIFSEPTGEIVIPEEPTEGETKMLYKVINSCKPRKSPTMYEQITLAELPIGTQFNGGTIEQVDSQGKVDDGVIFVQDESTMYWIPLVYAGKEYARSITVSNPPVEENDSFTATIEDDLTGEIWSGTLSKIK